MSRKLGCWLIPPQAFNPRQTNKLLTMGTRGIFQVYDSTTNTYTYYYVHSDSMHVLKELRKKLRACKSLKSIRKAIAGLVADGILREQELEPPGADSYTPAKCWPSLEYSLIVKLFPAGDFESWEIHPVHECMQTEFKLVKHQRAAVFNGSNKL